MLTHFGVAFLGPKEGAVRNTMLVFDWVVHQNCETLSILLEAPEFQFSCLPRLKTVT